MTSKDQEWARAYARQTLSDLDARDKLASAGGHKCHRLHFLQMAAEKVCKAHLVTNNGHANVRKTHAYVAKHLPIIARKVYSDRGTPITPWELSAIRSIAYEIEVLAPACDDGNVRLDNSEYPWEDGSGNVRAPCEYSFPKVDDSSENKIIVKLIRLMRAPAESYAH
jgi:hypothetical protein